MDDFDAPARTFVRGQGNYLFDAQQRRVFDAVSSIWTTVHGHCHPLIVQAVAQQAARLDHATLLGATHPPAEQLAAALAKITGLPRVFFSGDGASAIEAALKMALHFWQEHGQPRRTRFVRLTDAYHGDTAGAMSVSDIGTFKGRYAALTFETASYQAAPQLLRAPDVAAAIVEPLVQAAAGIRLVELPAYEPLQDMTPLLIVDEIATGFGRTGTMFAYEQLALRPDIVCLGKGMTGGALAMSATLASQRVFEVFRGAGAPGKFFFHGHSYAGNPIACAAALANLEIFAAEGTLDRVGVVAQALEPTLRWLQAHRLVREVRRAGLMIGIEIDESNVDAGTASTPAWRLASDLYERGHFTRPIGSVVQLVPPLTSTLEELQRFCADLYELLG